MAQPAINQDIDQDNLPGIPIQRQKNIPIETIIDLHNKNLSHSQIAKIVGCSTANITNRLSIAGVTSLRAYKHNRADIFAVTQARILNNITDEDVKKASMLQKATAIGIMYDKECLERGKATQILSIHADIQAIKAMQDAKIVEAKGES